MDREASPTTTSSSSSTSAASNFQFPYEFLIVTLEKYSNSYMDKLVEHFQHWNLKSERPYIFSLETNSTETASLQFSTLESSKFAWTQVITKAYAALFTIYFVTKCLGSRDKKGTHFFPPSSKPIFSYCHALILVLIECALVNLTLILAFPILFAFHFSIYISRVLLQLYLDYVHAGHPRLQLLNGADGLWAAECEAHTCPFTCLYVLEGTCDLRLLRDRLLHKFVNKRDPLTGELLYKRMKYCMRTFFGFLCWAPAHEFHIEDHVRLATTEKNEDMTESQVFHLMGNLAHTVMPKEERSPWEILVIPRYRFDNESQTANGYPNGKNNYYALIFRIHHGLMDGISAASALNFAVADHPVKISVDPVNFSYPKVAFYVKLLGVLKFLIFGARAFFWSLATRETHEFTNKNLTGPKHMGWTRPFHLDCVKAIRKSTGTSSTSVFASVFATALKNVKKERVGGQELDRVYSVTTLALLPYPNRKPQNRFTIGHIGVNVRNTSSVIDRLQEAHHHVYSMATSYDLYLHYVMTHLIGRCPERLIKYFLQISHASAIISNVPGPLEKLTILGSQVQQVAGWIPIKGRTGVCLVE